MNRGTVAKIDLSALTHNLSVVRHQAPESKIAAVVKADAYGHGVVPVCRALAGADAFAVAFADEAIALREAGIEHPIIVLEGMYNAADLELALHHKLELVIHAAYQLEWLKRLDPAAGIVLWLKLDTGMHRLGLNEEEFTTAWSWLRKHKPGAELRLMSHFACADECDNPLTQVQLDRFHNITADLTAPVSLANSAAILAWPRTHADWVRPGILLYGGSPFGDQDGRRAEDFNLKPVMTLTSSLIAIRDIKPGEAVGYGQQWRARQPTRVGTVAIGYADGYPRALPSGTPVGVRGTTVPLLGRVSMDMISIDLSQVPHARIGDDVVLWGEGNPADSIAALAGTICYELFCSVSPRVPRLYS